MAFKNLDGSGPQPFESVLKWAFFDKLTGRRRKSPAQCKVPWVDPDLALLRTAPQIGEQARLTWLGHASWLVQLDGISLVIDPVLGPSISGMVKRNVAPGLTTSELPTLTATLVTHNHRDHLDAPTLQRIGAKVIAGAKTSPLIESLGLTCQELGWWDSTRLGEVTVHFVPSQHWSRRGLNDSNQMLWGGFVIEGSTACIYHSGDTAYFDGFKEIGKKFPQLSAALLPIGAYDPAWFMEKQHMNPEQAVQAFEDLAAAQFFAMHWGTFKLTDEPLDEPPRRLRTEWVRRGWDEHRMSILAVGETVTLPARH